MPDTNLAKLVGHNFMFTPSNEPEMHQHLMLCAARTAGAKGLKNSEWHFESEIIAFLRDKHPETWATFREFADAYEAWLKFTWKTRKPINDLEILELTKLTQKRDETRDALVAHLGLND